MGYQALALAGVGAAEAKIPWKGLKLNAVATGIRHATRCRWGTPLRRVPPCLTPQVR
jgi:hypothetical protein